MASTLAARPIPSGIAARQTPALGGRFFRLGVAAVVCTYLLIIAGATVRVTGSGLGCPDWPTCHGQLIPPLETAALIEYTHRLLGALTSPLILAMPVSAWLFRRERRILYPALALPFLLALQIGLGAFVVWLELPPLAVLVHLGFAMLILGVLVWIATLAAPSAGTATVSDAPKTAGLSAATAPSRLGTLLTATAVVIFALVLTGAYTRASGASIACAGFPGCVVPQEALNALPNGGAGLVHVHLLHRTMAYLTSALVLVSVIAVWRQGGRPERFAAAAWVASVLIQVAIGIAAVSTGLPTVLRGAHVAGAAAVWACSVLALAIHLRTNSPSPSGRPTLGGSPGLG